MGFFYVEPRASKETLKIRRDGEGVFRRWVGSGKNEKKVSEHRSRVSVGRMHASLVAGARSVPRGARQDKHRLWCRSSSAALIAIDADACNASHQAVFDEFPKEEFLDARRDPHRRH
jgi:hypothetical protein